MVHDLDPIVEANETNLKKAKHLKHAGYIDIGMRVRAGDKYAGKDPTTSARDKFGEKLDMSQYLAMALKYKE